MLSPQNRAAFLVGLAAVGLRVVRAQDVNGVSLGVTTAAAVLTTRNDRPQTGKNVDGWLYYSFGTVSPRYTYYFSAQDSVIEWARVSVTDGYTAERVHEAFGSPDTTAYGADLSKQESFKHGSIFVEYKPDGSVNYVEYHATYPISLRRTDRANRVIDSVLTAVLVREHHGLTDSAAADSVRGMSLAKALIDNWGHTPLASQAPALAPPPLARALAERYEDLCIRINCVSTLTMYRAGDGTP
jgi:hypothetical protein